MVGDAVEGLEVWADAGGVFGAFKFGVSGFELLLGSGFGELNALGLAFA